MTTPDSVYDTSDRVQLNLLRGVESDSEVFSRLRAS